MYANRVEVFHTAHGNCIALAVSDDFKFYFFPTADTFLNQYLMYRRSTQAVLCNFQKFILCICDTAAATAKRKCRSYDDRQSDLFGYAHRVFNIVDDFGRNSRLVDFRQRVLEHLSVFGFVDSIYSCAEKRDSHLVKESLFCKLHTKRQTGLSAKR